jgi:hypothetical protein
VEVIDLKSHDRVPKSVSDSRTSGSTHDDALVEQDKVHGMILGMATKMETQTPDG